MWIYAHNARHGQHAPTALPEVRSPLLSLSYLLVPRAVPPFSCNGDQQRWTPCRPTSRASISPIPGFEWDLFRRVVRFCLGSRRAKSSRRRARLFFFHLRYGFIAGGSGRRAFQRARPALGGRIKSKGTSPRFLILLRPLTVSAATSGCRRGIDANRVRVFGLMRLLRLGVAQVCRVSRLRTLNTCWSFHPAFRYLLPCGHVVDIDCFKSFLGYWLYLGRPSPTLPVCVVETCEKVMTEFPKEVFVMREEWDVLGTIIAGREQEKEDVRFLWDCIIDRFRKRQSRTP